MRKQDYIIHLIHSLNGNEKRYFRLFPGAQPGERSYLKLFDFLENKQQYDVGEICEGLHVTPTQLADIKRYLVQMLLKSIRHYKEETSGDSIVSNSIIEAVELIDRGLPEFALEVIEKALEKARKEELLHHLPKLLHIKAQAFNKAGMYEELEPLEKGFREAQDVYYEFHRYCSSLYGPIVKFEQSRKHPSEFKLHNHPLLKTKPEKLKSRRAQLAWFAVMSLYYVATKKDLKKTLALVRKEVAFFKANEQLRNFSPYQYLQSQIRLVTTEGQSENYETAWKENEKLLQLLAKEKNVSRQEIEHMQLFAAYCKVYFTFRLGKYAEAVALSKKVYAQKDLMVHYVHFSIIFDYALALFHIQSTTEAIEKLEELLQLNTDVRMDLQLLVRPLLIIAHLSTGNHQLVVSLVKTTRAWVKKKNIVDKEIALLLSHAYAIANAPAAQRKAEWNKLKENILSGKLAKTDKQLHLQRWMNELFNPGKG